MGTRISKSMLRMQARQMRLLRLKGIFHNIMLASFAIACVCLVAALLLSTGCSFGPSQPPQDICSAQHSWNNYRLDDSDTSPVVVNNSSYTPDLPSWNDLGTPIMLRRSGDGFQIVVEDGGDAESGWLGIATAHVDKSGYIRKATVTMNTVLLARHSARVVDHVLCQELGHLLGLGHHTDLDSCMDDCTRAEDWLSCMGSEAGTTPSAHDAEQLRIIYAGDAERASVCAGVISLHAFEDEVLSER